MTKPAEISAADRRFAEYRRTGDPETLAAVFDETAPKLLLLAVQLTRDQFRAEDLVQATFVRLIENASAYDQDRPFLPWASTILVNEARKAWRNDRRDPEADRLTHAIPDDPLRVAAEADTIEVLEAKIDDLGENYRAVVRLKVMHGMKPGEIARVLSISPQLARTRLSRGLDQLRALLPAGIASSLVLLAGGRGLAGVRAAVLERATAARAAEVATDPLAARATSDSPRKTLAGEHHALKFATLSLTAAAVIGVGCWVAFTSSRDAIDTTQRDEVVARDEATLRSGSATDSPDFASVTVRSHREVVAAHASTTASEHDGWTLEGVVRSASGSPLADARVDVTVLHGCELAHLPPVFTDEDGRYLVDVDALRALGDLGLLGAGLLVDVCADGHWPAPVELLEDLPDTTSTDCALRYDLALQVGRTVRAELLSPDGTPHRGTSSVRMSSADPDATPHWRHFEAGEDVLVSVDGPGPWHFEVISTVGSARVSVPTLPADGDLGPVALETGSVVRARFLVADGTPVPYANYSLWPVGAPVTDEPVDHGRSDANGRILSYGLEPGTYRLRLTYGAIEPIEVELLTDAPPTDLYLEGQSLSIRLVDGEGRLVPGLALLYEHHAPGGVRHGRETINDVGGVFDFLVPFGSRWRFRSGTPEVHFEAFEHLASADEPRAVRTVRVSPESRRGSLDLRLSDASGHAIERFVVDLQHLGSDESSREYTSADLANPLPIGDYQGTLNADLRDVDGLDSFLPREVSFSISEGRDTPLHVVVERAGRLEARVHDAGARKLVGDVALEREADGRWLRVSGFAQETGDRWSIPTTYDLERPLRALRALPQGPVRLRLRGADFVTHPVACTIRTDALTEVRFELEH